MSSNLKSIEEKKNLLFNLMLRIRNIIEILKNFEENEEDSEKIKISLKKSLSEFSSIKENIITKHEFELIKKIEKENFEQENKVKEIVIEKLLSMETCLLEASYYKLRFQGIIWKSGIINHLHFEEDEKYKKFQLKDIIVCSVADSINKNKVKYEYKFYESEKNCNIEKNFFGYCSFVPVYEPSDLLFKIITNFIRKRYLVESNIEIIVTILEIYSHIWDYNFICNYCKKYLRFESLAVGFLPPTCVLPNNKKYHIYCFEKIENKTQP